MVKFCRVCHSENLIEFLDLGFTPLADDFLPSYRLEEPEVYYPLQVFVCSNCSLVQLGYIVPPEILFQQDYPYASSTTKTGREHFYSLAKEACSRFNTDPENLIIDIGSNVGVLLQGFRNQGINNVLGIDPAENICEIAHSNGIETICDFFSEELVQRIVATKGKAKIVTGTNVIAHIDDHHAMVRALDALLGEKGVFIFEAPYWVRLMENLEYDTIYHEHLSYLSVKPMVTLFSDNVDGFVKLENERKVYDIDALNDLAKVVQGNRDELTWLLRSLKREGKRIAGVSAPAKGMTLLNYCRIGPETLDFLTEKAPLKIGKYAPGVHIPIMPDTELIEKRPDYALLLAWNFADEIMRNLDAYRQAGGKFIIPIPKPHVVD